MGNAARYTYYCNICKETQTVNFTREFEHAEKECQQLSVGQQEQYLDRVWQAMRPHIHVKKDIGEL